MDVFLRSCECNPDLTWLIFSDIEKPEYRPENIQFIELRKSDLSKLIYEKTGISHALENPHKLCDFKPMYGHIFEEYLEGYDFWGHCDMDVIWGDLSAFLKSISYQIFDIISTRPNTISGHFTLYRNIDRLNLFYQEVPNYRRAFEKSYYQGFDEGFFSYHIFNEISTGKLDVKPYWEKRNCIDNAELMRMPNGWYWKNGKIKNYLGKEGNYLHMIKWKKILNEVIVSDPTKVTYFNITQFGIWEGKIPSKYLKKMIEENGFIYAYRYWRKKIKNAFQDKVKKSQLQNRANVPKGYEVLE